jgi:hypothetical protein
MRGRSSTGALALYEPKGNLVMAEHTPIETLAELTAPR